MEQIHDILYYLKHYGGVNLREEWQDELIPWPTNFVVLLMFVLVGIIWLIITAPQLELASRILMGFILISMIVATIVGESELNQLELKK